MQGKKMKKIGGRINKYLIAIIATILMAFLGIVVGLGGISLDREVRADTERLEGSWLDNFYGYTADLSGGTAPMVNITSPQDFAWACLILYNATSSLYENTTFYIKTPVLDMGMYYWTPMGSPEFPFKGRFVLDESLMTKKVTIKNLRISNTKDQYSRELNAFGLFGAVDQCVSDGQGLMECFELENIEIDIDTSVVPDTDSDVYIGGLAGYYAGKGKSTSPNDAAMTDCVASGVINVDLENSASTKNVHVGGLVGYVSEQSKISFVNGGTNSVDITIGTNTASTYYVGGYAGTNAGTISGIASSVDRSKVSTSPLVMQSRIYSGVGYCGLIAGQNTTSAKIQEMNVGKEGDTKAELVYKENLNPIVGGGIVGLNNGQVSTCKSYALITAYNQIFGGIIGQNKGYVLDCINFGDIVVDGVKAMTYGAVDIDTSKIVNMLYLGGIVGLNETTSATIMQCTNHGAIKGENLNAINGGMVGGIAGVNKNKISNCLNTANLGFGMGAENIGGIAGVNEGIIDSDIAATDGANLFTANYGSITGYLYVGGIAGILGRADGSSSDNFSIAYCYNLGELTGTNNSFTNIGGIVGWIKNCGTETKIDNCFNKGSVGTIESTNIAGGIVAKASAKFILSNMANYSDVLANTAAGGIMGAMESPVLPTFERCLATGRVLSNDVTKMGGVIGYSNLSATASLTSCVFDLGVAGYDLPQRLAAGYTPGQVSPLRLVGSESFSTKNAPITYYLTLPGVDDTNARSYSTYYLRENSDNWYFKDVEQMTTHNVHYYPVLKVFFDAGVIGDTVNANCVMRVPSQNLIKVMIQNYLPDYWDTTGDAIVYCQTSINLYPNMVLESVLDDAGNGQYIIQGQTVARPTASATVLDRQEYEDNGILTDYYLAQNADGREGKYWSHKGFNPGFVVDSPLGTTAFDFATPITENKNVFIVWTPKSFGVTVKIFNDDTNMYEDVTAQLDAPITITYNMKPGSTQEVQKMSRLGKTFWGWRTDSNLNRVDYATEDDWINAWSTASNILPCDVLYEDGIVLYGMFSSLKITLTLHGGQVNGVAGIFTGRGNSTQYMTIVQYEQEIQLDIPVLDVDGYEFRGYYSEPDGGVICVDMSGKFVSTLMESTEFFARWIYTIQTISYISIKDNGDFVTLKEVNANFNRAIAIENRLNQQKAMEWGIDYTLLDANVDPKGYSFAGCFADTNFTTPFDFETKILDSMNIYVKWDLLSFTLKLNANIGKNPDGILRAGGWGESQEKIITLLVPYNTNLLNYLRDWRNNNIVDSSVTVEGFTPLEMAGDSYLWSREAIAMGVDFDHTAEYIVSLSNNNYWMPANDNLELFVIWQRDTGRLIFNANGGNFGDGITKSFDVFYEYNLKMAIEDFASQMTVPTKQGWAFKHWSLSPDGGPVTDTARMGLECTLYAVYGEQRTVTFYVIGAYPENIVGQIVVFDGATIGEGLNMEEIDQKIDAILNTGDGTESAFELDYWVEMTYDLGYNITESSEKFDFENRVINENINLLAKLKPNENYVAPNKDTTNYILVAGIVMVVALVLLFVVILTRPSKEKLTTNKKSKNKDIQAQLDQIRELEQRRKDLDNPYD